MLADGECAPGYFGLARIETTSCLIGEIVSSELLANCSCLHMNGNNSPRADEKILQPAFGMFQCLKAMELVTTLSHFPQPVKSSTSRSRQHAAQPKRRGICQRTRSNSPVH